MKTLLPALAGMLALAPLTGSALTVSSRETPHALFIEKNVLLLDDQGNQAPVKVGDLKKSPLGIYVAVTPAGNHFTVNYCTATHLKRDYVSLAAHCIPTDANATTWFVFYAKDGGKRQIVPVYDYYFRGEGQEDVAVAKLHPEAVPLWDEADFQLSAFEKSPDSPDIGVSIWSYSPIIRFPKWQKKYPGLVGMVYQQNRCVASQLLPRIEIRSKKGKRKTGELLFGDKLNPKKHLFMDKCQNKIVQGNSGSLITHANNFNYKLGILHLALGEHETVWKQLVELGFANDPLVDIYYYGVDGKRETLDQHLGSFSVGAGTLFDVIAERSPTALPQP